jgi:hypothetical protein
MPTATAAPLVSPAPASSVPSPSAPASGLVPTPASGSSLIGDWRFRAETGERDIGGILQFRLEDGELVGSYISPSGSPTLLSDLQVLGNRISWNLATPRTTWQLKGTFTDTWMNGTFQTTTRTVQWTATKVSGAATTTPTPSPGP